MPAPKRNFSLIGDVTAMAGMTEGGSLLSSLPAIPGPKFVAPLTDGTNIVPAKSTDEPGQ